MIVIGVTGGVGTGKSTVARILAEQGAEVLDADRIAHTLMRPGTAVWRKIKSGFGREILAADGRIDRRRLGAVAFSNQKRLDRLCRIVHPAVRRRIVQRIRAIRRRNPKAVVVLDIPLLIESASAYKTDALVVVTAPLRGAAQRLKSRSGWSFNEVKKRQNFQLPLREKTRRADFVVKNGGSIASTRRQVIRMWKQIVKENG